MAAAESSIAGSSSALPEYSRHAPGAEIVSTLRSTHDQMKKCISIDLLTACQREVNFLRMIDRKAPVLYEKNVVDNAIRRYETYWLPMQVGLAKVFHVFKPLVCMALTLGGQA